MNRKLKLKIIERFGTQSDFAQAASLDDATVSRVVRGRRELSVEEKARWAKLLKTETSVFVMED
jgi:plasmid maintenance system antidote protein VapI